MIATTAVAFAPAVLNHFVDWDDPENFIANSNYRGLGWAQLRWMWTTVLLGHWVPATWMTLGLDYLAWGMNPVGYHLTNVLLHVASAAVCYLVALRVFRAATSTPDETTPLAWRLSAAFAALAFAVHPLRVESVAWVTERRDVLSGLFFLLAVWAYLRDADAAGEGNTGRRTWYWVSLGWFALALLSKAIAVTLPVVLVVLDVYPLGRLGSAAEGWWSPQARRRWAEKIPFVLASAVVVPIALIAARSGANLLPIGSFGVLERSAVGLYGLTFYLWKTVVPLRLSPFYPLNTPIALLSAPYLVSGLVAVAITLLAIGVRRRWPALGAAWLVYAVTLLPVSGIFQNGPQITADRYSYLPSLSGAMLAGAGVLACWRAATHTADSRALALSMTGVATLLVATLTVLTWQQIGIWRDPERLWSHAMAIEPSSVVHEHMGYVRRQQGRLGEAIEHYRTASLMRPGSADLRIQLGNVLVRQGALDEAISHYREAVSIDPGNAEAFNSWGRALAREGKWEEAIDKYREALRLKPDSVPHYNWGNALFSAGRFEEAIAHYQEAVRIEPGAAEAYNNLGQALAQQGKWEEAIVQYRQALRLRPSYPLASSNLDRALSRVGDAPRR